MMTTWNPPHAPWIRRLVYLGAASLAAGTLTLGFALITS